MYPTFRTFLHEARLPTSLTTWARRQLRTLTDDERTLLSDYADEGHYNINLYLRHAGNVAQMRKQASRTLAPQIYKADKHVQTHLTQMRSATQLLDDIFTKFRLSQSLVVYRGTDEHLPMFANPKKLVGKTLTLPGYTSTSTDRETANHWEFNRGVLLVLTLPSGARALPLTSDLTGDREEAEVVLPQNTRVTVQKVTRQPGGIHEDYWVIEGRVTG